MNEIKQLIEKDNFDRAILKIEQFYRSKEKYLYLSLLFQLTNEYEKEKLLIDEALIHFADSKYMQKRKKWHEKPMFKKCEPRPPLHLDRDPKYIPKQSTLDKMSFVTGGDSNYFEFIVECIESIKGTRFYNNIDIQVLDSGLKKHQRDYLYKRWKIKTQKITWEVKIKEARDKDWNVVSLKEIKQYQTLISRCFIHKYFTAYEYFFWIDPDSWIQDERAIDKFIYLSEKQGHAFTHFANYNSLFDFEPKKNIPKHNLNLYCEYKKQHVIKDYWSPLWCTAFCVNKEFLKNWAIQIKAIIEKLDYCWFWGFEEYVASIVINQNDFIITDSYSSCEIRSRNTFFITDQKGLILYESNQIKPLGIVLLTDDKKEYYKNTLELNTNTIKKVSWRYRVWPYMNKSNLKKELLKVFTV